MNENLQTLLVIMRTGGRFQHRYDWGNGSDSGWIDIRDIEHFCDNAPTWFDTKDQARIGEIAKDLSALKVNGMLRVYHGGANKLVGGEKQYCSEFNEFRRIA